MLKHLVKILLVTAMPIATLLAPAVCFSENEDIAAIELEQQRTLRELEFNKVKHTEALKKLEDARKELSARKQQLQKMEQELDENAGDAAKELLENEKRRLAVAELSVQSQQSALERLERKQTELNKYIETSKSDIENIKKAIAQANDQEQRRARQQALATQRELERLKTENSDLKDVLARERERLAKAELRIEELVRTADFKQRQIEQLEEEISQLKPPQDADSTVLKTNKNFDLSLTVLDGEMPIFQEDDGEQMIIRSHSIDGKKLVMVQVGPDLYQADINMEPGKAYFDIHRRRYRGTFPENHSGNYRFFYDVSDEEKPVLYVETATPYNQMITNSIEDF